MIVKTLWSAGSDATGDPTYCIEDGVHISGAVRRAWKDDPNVHVIEVYNDNDGSTGLKLSLEHHAGKSQAPSVPSTGAFTATVAKHTIKIVPDE